MANPNSSWRLCIPRQKVTSIRTPQHRQYMLISNFPDLAHLSIREEATLVKNWSKDRPESLKLQNLALATIPGPALRSYPKNTTEDVQHALDKCESLCSGNNLILHGKPSAIAKDFPAYMAVLRRHFSPNKHFQC